MVPMKVVIGILLAIAVLIGYFLFAVKPEETKAPGLNFKGPSDIPSAEGPKESPPVLQ